MGVLQIYQYSYREYGCNQRQFQWIDIVHQKQLITQGCGNGCTQALLIGLNVARPPPNLDSAWDICDGVGGGRVVAEKTPNFAVVRDAREG